MLFLTHLMLLLPPPPPPPPSALDTCTVSPILCYGHRQFLTHLIPFPPISAKDICTVSPLPRTIALFHPCQGSFLHCFTPLMSHFNLFFPFCARDTNLKLFLQFYVRGNFVLGMLLSYIVFQFCARNADLILFPNFELGKLFPHHFLV